MLKKVMAAGVAILIVCATVVGSLSVAQNANDYLVEVDAEAKAWDWSKLLRTNTDNFVALVSGAPITSLQRDQIHKAISYGNIYGVDIYRQDGSLTFHDLNMPAEKRQSRFPNRSQPNDIVFQVLETGQTVVTRPRVHGPNQRVNAHVYYAIWGENGIPSAVLKIHVDQTAASAFLTDKLQFLAYVGAFLLLMSFAIPYWALVKKRRQENAARKQAEYLSLYDKTTGLMNRDNMIIHLNKRQKHQEIDAAKICTMLVATDGCKKINEAYGHKAGDAFLEHVGHAIRTELQSSGLACRYNGDDFIVTSEQIIADGAADLAERIRIRSSAPFQFEGKSISGTISIGVHYDCNAGGLSFDQRISKANIALKKAKLEGRDRHVFYSTELEIQVERRRYVEEALANAMQDRRLDLHFQPILDARSLEVTSYEALLRLKDKDGIPIPPLEFIPVAEELGTIEAIGYWTIEKAMCAARSWPRDVSVSVNLSPCQFKNDNLVENIQDIMLKMAFDPKRLEIEVTESLLIDNTDQVARQLTELRKIGISIALDDFGTGFSSLSYLWQFGFDKLKIDKSFIDGWESDPEKLREILDTIIILGHRLDMKVTAEGIETQDQADMLLSLGCDTFQGFLFAKPAPAQELNHRLLQPTFDAPISINRASAN